MGDLETLGHLGHITAAWKKRDSGAALKHAHALKAEGIELSLNDSMRVVILLALDDSPLFQEAAQRWIDRLRREGRQRVEVDIASAAVRGLRGPLGRKCEIVLRRLMCGEFPPGHRLDDMNPPAGPRVPPSD